MAAQSATPAEQQRRGDEEGDHTEQHTHHTHHPIIGA